MNFTKKNLLYVCSKIGIQMYRGDSCVDVSHNNALAMAKELSEVNRCFVYRSLQCPERVERANFITLPLYSESKYGAWTTAYEYNGVCCTPGMYVRGRVEPKTIQLHLQLHDFCNWNSWSKKSVSAPFWIVFCLLSLYIFVQTRYIIFCWCSMYYVYHNTESRVDVMLSLDWDDRHTATSNDMVKKNALLHVINSK